jgi:hypothetical protein
VQSSARPFKLGFGRDRAKIGRDGALARVGHRNDLGLMAKSSSNTARSAKTGKLVGGSKVLGTTKDGVHILKPRSRATHFTQKELRDAVASVIAAKRAG